MVLTINNQTNLIVGQQKSNDFFIIFVLVTKVEYSETRSMLSAADFNHNSNDQPLKITK